VVAACTRRVSLNRGRNAREGTGEGKRRIPRKARTGRQMIPLSTTDIWKGPMEYDYYAGEWLERVADNPSWLTVADLRTLLDDVSEHGEWPMVVHITEDDGYLTAYPVAVEVSDEKLVLRAQLTDPNGSHS